MALKYGLQCLVHENHSVLLKLEDIQVRVTKIIKKYKITVIRGD